MNRTRTRNISAVAIAALIGLTGCTTYVEQRPVVVSSEPGPVEPPPPPPPVYAEAAPVEVVIRDERDFYEPLNPYGHWQYVGAYGRCWVPARVEPSWRPYSNGHWESTDAGWYWVSDEPWGWATYHYGRWDFDTRVGWYWIPQTMWAPAWVTWHRGDGYIGWAPLPPSARFASSGLMEVNTRAIQERGYVFVEERRFLEPIRPATVVNNTTIINKTVNITNVKVVNNTIINEGPRAQVIEQASGHKLRPVPAHELRHKIEAPVAAAHVGPVAPASSHVETDSERKAAERARQEKIQAERQAQQKAQAEAERARIESERQAKIEAERQAQAERARVEAERRKAESERKAQLEAEQRAHEQARQAEAEAARKKQEAEIRAREVAQREARQKQVRIQEDGLKQDVAHTPQFQPHSTQTLSPKAEAAHQPKVVEKNQTEAERRAEQQKGNRKGQIKKAVESEPAPAGTNSPVAGTKTD